MFRYPDANRVRRDNLLSPTSSRESTPDASITNLFLSHVQQDYEPQDISTTQSADPDEVSEDELEFRFFAPTSHDAQPAVQRVRLRSPTPDSANPGFIDPHRDRSYYFTGVTSKECLEQYQSAAISGADVLQRAKLPWPGCDLSWRVIHISSSGNPISVTQISQAKVSMPKLVNAAAVEASSGRKRAGKKKRIAVRKKFTAEKEKKEKSMREKEEKEAAEREKRTRRNREKKVKKKAKEKAKKAAGTDEATGEDINMGGVDQAAA